jgi:uncharacterized protein (TIGR00730 family)
MGVVRSVAVFCGSKIGLNPAWAEAARELGIGLARVGIRLVYGGGQVGIMGVLADAVLGAEGNVLGVIPRFLTRFEVAHTGLNDLVVTDSMHSRKRHMFEEADAFVMLPGAVGTFDETIEVITWRQLGLHDKPILIANIAGSANAFVALIEDAITNGFMVPENRDLFEVLGNIPAVLARLGELNSGFAGTVERL